MFRTRVGQCWSCFHGTAGEELFLRSSRVRIKDKRGACSSPPTADRCCLSTGCCLARCSRGRGRGRWLWTREQMKNETLLLSHWTSSVSLGRFASVSAAFILLVLKAALLRNRHCFQHCTCQPCLRSCQIPLGGFSYYFKYIYIFHALKNIYIYMWEHAAPDGFETLSFLYFPGQHKQFLLELFSFPLQLCFKYLQHTCKTVHLSSVIFTQGKKSSLPFAAFLSSDFFGGGAWTAAELWDAFPTFGGFHGVTSQLSYITLSFLYEPKLAAT